MSSTYREIKYLHPSVRPKAQKILDELNRAEKVRETGIRWVITETYRSTARQLELFAKGRTVKGQIVTNVDGVRKLSNHQYGLAFDLAPLITKDGKEVLAYDAANVNWQYVGHCIRAQGLEWGGDWRSFKDRPHAEWPSKDRKTYKAAWIWQKANGGKG